MQCKPSNYFQIQMAPLDIVVIKLPRLPKSYFWVYMNPQI